MPDGLVHGQPLRRGLLACDNHVDIVAAAQAVVRHRKKRIGVRRQIDPDDVRFLVDDVVDEARILVAEAIVVLPPDMRTEEIVQRADRPSPGISLQTFSHFACWLNIESTMWMKAS